MFAEEGIDFIAAASSGLSNGVNVKSGVIGIRGNLKRPGEGPGHPAYDGAGCFIRRKR